MKVGDKILVTDGTGAVFRLGWIGEVGVIVSAPHDDRGCRWPYLVSVNNYRTGGGLWCSGVPLTELTAELY